MHIYCMDWEILFVLIELYVFIASFPSSRPASLSAFFHSSHGPKLLCRSFFLYFSCSLELCMFLLGSFLLSRFSGTVNCRLSFLCFMSKIYLWVSPYYSCLAGAELPHSIWCFLDSSICLQNVIIFSASQYSIV